MRTFIGQIAKRLKFWKHHQRGWVKFNYQFEPRYSVLTGTNRHCANHLDRLATMMERNAHDRSYGVPVCQECIG